MNIFTQLTEIRNLLRMANHPSRQPLYTRHCCTNSSWTTIYQLL